MITFSEFLRSMTGAWGLLHRQPGAMNQFNLSLQGFWRSFQIYIFIAPLQYVILSILGHSLEAGLTDGSSTTLTGAAVIYTAHIISFPVLMIFLSRHLKLEHNYVPYIIALNWAGVIQFLISGLSVMLLYGGLLSTSIFAFASLILMILFVLYEWYVARVALEASGAVAAGLVVVKTLLTLVLQEGFGRLFGA